MGWRGSVDYTSQLEARSDGGDSGRGLERPSEAFFCLVCVVFISEMEISVSGTGSQGSA